MNRLLSPAKINIGLAITGRRPDGYHLLESLFWPVDFCDEIELDPSGPGGVFARWAEDAPFDADLLPQGEGNLVEKVRRAAGGHPAGSIRLLKRIPMGGGLGGGSSNAGTVLRELRDRGVLSAEEAEAIAPRVGADVPFFLDPRPSWVTGIGEHRRALTLPPELARELHFLLIVFPRPTITATVFSNYRRAATPFSPSSEWREGALNRAVLDAFFAHARNDLEIPAAASYPALGEVLAALRETNCDFSSLSGSGSTCFAIYRTQRKRAEAAKELSDLFRKHQCKGVPASTFVSR